MVPKKVSIILIFRKNLTKKLFFRKKAKLLKIIFKKTKSGGRGEFRKTIRHGVVMLSRFYKTLKLAFTFRISTQLYLIQYFCLFLEINFYKKKIPSGLEMSWYCRQNVSLYVFDWRSNTTIKERNVNLTEECKHHLDLIYVVM